MAPNFANGKVYCIRNRNDGDKIVYVGSTTRPLSERMADHRKSIKRSPELKIYKLMGEVGVEHFHIELLVDFPCERKEQLLKAEGEQIRKHNTMADGVNARIAGRGHAEYYVDNKEAILANVKANTEANKDKIRAYKHSYGVENKEAIAAKRKEQYEENREATIARVHAYAEANKETIAARGREYRNANKEVVKARKLEYRKAHAEELNAKQKAYMADKRAAKLAAALAPAPAEPVAN